jgi:hypothetical protein
MYYVSFIINLIYYADELPIQVIFAMLIAELHLYSAESCDALLAFTESKSIFQLLFLRSNE